MQIAVRHNLQLYDPVDASHSEADALVLPVAEAQAVMGETVAAYLARVAWRFDLPTVCRINGEYYARAEWPETALAVNDNVEFVSRPLGPAGSGGSTFKTIASVVALIALTAVAGPAGGAIAGAAGLTAGTFAFAAASALASAAIVGAGALAISFFMKPKAGGKTNSSDELYSFGLAGNAARPLQPIPVLNGRVRFAPDFAAPTYSEYDGDTMTDYGLYGLTCKRMRVEQVLIGDTPIWDYLTGYNPDYPGITLQIVEPGDQVTLYPVNVVTAGELSGSELSQTFTPGFIVNAAGTLAKQLLVDFVWPGGAFVTYKDRTLSASTGIEIQARTVNAAGAPTGPFVTVLAKTYTQTKQSQIRVTERITVSSGRYEVRGRRTNPSVQDNTSEKINGTDAVAWTALRAHIDGAQSFPRVMTLAVKGIANKANSGVTGGQLRVIGTRILPVWTGSAFVEQPTRSIAYAALDWWRDSDYGGGRPLSDTDFQAFVAYDALWTSLGHTFDFRFTEVMNLDDVLETVLKAGRAFPAPVGDKLTIVRDEPRGLSRMLFTENDILKDSLEIDYALSDETWADGMVGEYLDETTWRLAEVSSAPDGVTLLKPARVQLQGIVNRKQATGAIRFMAAESQYRRITVNWTARLEGRLLKRGSLVKLSAEEPETWGQSAEVVTVGSDGRSLILDPPPTWTVGANHYVEIRQRDGRPWGPVLVARGADDAVAVVNSSGAASVALALGVTLADALARTDRQERPWLAFSPGQPRTFPVLITSGDPDQDGEHIHLTGVINAPEVHAVDEAGVVPLPAVSTAFRSTLPVIIGLAGRINQVQLRLMLTAGWQPATNAVSYVADISADSGQTWASAYEGDRTTFTEPVGGSDSIRVRVAGVTAEGMRGAYFITEVDCPVLVLSADAVGAIIIDYPDLAETVQAELDRLDGIQDQAEAAGQAAAAALVQATDRLNQLRLALAADPAVRQGHVDALLGDVRQDLETLTTSSQRNFDALNLLQGMLASAGLEIIPSQGRARFYAIEQVQTAVGTEIANFSITVDALSRKIDLYGSVQAGDIEGLIESISTVQVLLDAVTTTVSTLATAAQFDGLSGRVSTAEQTITAQGAEIAQKASVATVDEQATTLSQVQQRLSAAEGLLTQSVQASTAGNADLALIPATLEGFADLLGRQIGALSQNVAVAETTLSARFDESGRAMAEIGTRLLVFQGEATAQFVSVTTAIADTTSALTQTQILFLARFAGNEASLATEIQARADGDSAQATRTDGLTTRMGAAEVGLTSVTSAYQTADAALGQRIDSITARVGTAEGLIAGETSARVSADTALTTQYNGLLSRVGNVETGVSNEATARVAGDAANASNVTTLFAQSASGTAGGRFGMSVVSAPAGVSVRIAAVASTAAGGQQRNAGWFLDLLPDGTSRFVVDANFFALTANGGLTYPFTFDGTTLTIPNLRVTQQILLPGAASDKYPMAVNDIDPGAFSENWREVPGTAVLSTPDAVWAYIFSGIASLTATAIGTNSFYGSVSLEISIGINGAQYGNVFASVSVGAGGGGIPNANTANSNLLFGPAQFEFYSAGQTTRFALLYRFRGSAGCTGRISYAQLKLLVAKR